MPTCDICDDTLRVQVLDIWSCQETARDYGQPAALEKLATHPMLAETVPCPSCLEEAHRIAVEALIQRKGDPWDPATFERSIQ